MTCISKTRADAAKLMPDSESASLKTPKTILISPATKTFSILLACVIYTFLWMLHQGALPLV